MPFLIRWPGMIQPGTRSQALIQNIDYAPTFLDAAGIEVPDDIQGRSLLPVFKNGGKAPADWRKGLYYFYSGEPYHNVAAHDGVCNERYKLFHVSKTDEWQLFDLVKDPSELKSVHDEQDYADVLKEMKALYSELRAQYEVKQAEPKTAAEIQQDELRKSLKEELRKELGKELKQEIKKDLIESLKGMPSD